jgi:hypothetical protein
MQYDVTKWDCAIAIAKISHPARLGVQVSTDGGRRSTRTAAKMHGEHSHVLLTKALLTGLALKPKSVVPNPRVLVTSFDATYLKRLRQQGSKHLRISEEMKEKLNAELATVTPTFTYGVEPRFLVALDDWLFRLPLDVIDMPGALVQEAA